MTENTFIITAGGSGTRMQRELPKQFLKINSEVVLMRTLRVFHSFNPQAHIILVLPEAQMRFWEQLCKEEQFAIPHKLVKGGETRFHSVQNGLACVGNTGIVAIHDGVRPLVSAKTIEKALQAAKLHGASVPVQEITDSIRQLTSAGSVPVNRSSYRLVQTPQCFQASIIKHAYEQEWHESFTDDASVVEKAGYKVHLTSGNRTNIKITHPEDLAIASLWWENKPT
jgi:2-C-methyl-D-erythritol 4-phosphate cytidylyltransferase